MKGKKEETKPILPGKKHDATLKAVHHKGGLSLFNTGVILVAENVGAGVLTFPKVLSDTGWGGLLLIIAACFVSAFNGIHLGHCWNILLERYPEYRDHIRDPYPAIAERAVGNWMRYVTTFFLDIGSFSISVIYLLLLSENIHSLMANTELNVSFCLWMIIVAGILLPLQWFGSPKDFWFTGVFSAGSSVIYCILIIISLMLQLPVKESEIHTNPISFTHVFLAFGTTIFAYGGAITFPTVQHDMKDPSKFSKVIVLSFSAILCIYLPVGISGYLIHGNNINANVILSLPEGGLRMTIEILVNLHFVFAFGILLNPLAQELDERFSIPKEFSIKRILLRSALVCGILFVGQTVPHFSALCSLVGGSSLTVLCFIVPSVFYIGLCQQSGDWPERVVPLYEKVFHGIIVIVGIFGGIAASYSSILEIVSPDTFVLPCYVNFTAAH